MNKNIKNLIIDPEDPNTVILTPGIIWYSNRVQKDANGGTGVGIFYIENQGIFLSSGLTTDFPIHYMMDIKKENKAADTVSPIFGIEPKDRIISFSKDGKPVDLIKILNDLDKESADKLLGGGMFFPFTLESHNFWIVEEDKVLINMVEILNSIFSFTKMGSRVNKDDWEAVMAQFMLIINKIKNSQRIQIMEDGAEGFKECDQLSVTSFIKQINQNNEVLA